MIPFQIVADPAQTFLEYGLLGALVLVLFIVVRHLYDQTKETSKTWKEMAIKNQDSFIELSSKQNDTNQRLIDIREKDILEAREFRRELNRRMDEMPLKVAENVIMYSVKNGKGKDGANLTPNV